MYYFYTKYSSLDWTLKHSSLLEQILLCLTHIVSRAQHEIMQCYHITYGDWRYLELEQQNSFFPKGFP